MCLQRRAREKQCLFQRISFGAPVRLLGSSVSNTAIHIRFFLEYAAAMVPNVMSAMLALRQYPGRPRTCRWHCPPVSGAVHMRGRSMPAFPGIILPAPPRRTHAAVTMRADFGKRRATGKVAPALCIVWRAFGHSAVGNPACIRVGAIAPITFVVDLGAAQQYLPLGRATF